MQFEELPKKLQMLLNDCEGAGNALRTDVDWILGKIKSPADIAQLLPKIEAVIATLQTIKDDLEDPVSFLEEAIESETHPCDKCIVTQNNLDANEHCDGCIYEARLIDYVPPHLR